MESALTVFVVSLLVHEDVSLHVPDELVGEKLRLLCRPQDVLSHVSHLSRRNQSLSLLLHKKRFKHYHMELTALYMEFYEVSEGRVLSVYLVVTKSLNNLRNVEQDGIL